MRITKLDLTVRVTFGQRTSSVFYEHEGFRFIEQPHGVLVIYGEGVTELVPWPQIKRAPVELDEAEKKALGLLPVQAEPDKSKKGKAA